MPRPSSEARSKANEATSSTVTNRFCGFIFLIDSSASSAERPVLAVIRSIPRDTISVSTYPGQMALIVKQVLASSSATERDTPSTQCFEAEYAVMYGAPVFPAIEAMLITRPHHFHTIDG